MGSFKPSPQPQNFFDELFSVAIDLCKISLQAISKLFQASFIPFCSSFSFTEIALHKLFCPSSLEIHSQGIKGNKLLSYDVATPNHRIEHQEVKNNYWNMRT